LTRTSNLIGRLRSRKAAADHSYRFVAIGQNGSEPYYIGLPRVSIGIVDERFAVDSQELKSLENRSRRGFQKSRRPEAPKNRGPQQFLCLQRHDTSLMMERSSKQNRVETF
jgi:hypothetical protein